MKLRVLAVDWNLAHNAITNSSFLDAPAFSDFDAVIINPAAVHSLLRAAPAYRDGRGRLTLDLYKDGGQGRDLRELLRRRADETAAVLSRTRGVILSMASPPDDQLHLMDYYANQLGVRDWLNIYAYLPTNDVHHRLVGDRILFQSRDGMTLNILERNHPLSQYLAAFRDEIRFSCVINPQNVVAKTIATDKVGDPIAIDVQYFGGRVILLPSFFPKDQSKAGAILVHVIRQLLGHSGLDEPEPQWLKDYPVEGLGGFEQDIGILSESIKTLEIEKDALELKQERLKRFQLLLYGQGKYVLEPVVREAFRVLGFDVREPDDYKEEYDLWATSSEGQVIGEIEGVDAGATGVDKYRQLFDYLDREHTKGSVTYKGILIANGFRLSHPSTRPDQFTEEARRGCTSQGFCMIATADLFQVVNAVLANPTDESLKLEVRKSIISTVGDWKPPAQ